MDIPAPSGAKQSYYLLPLQMTSYEEIARRQQYSLDNPVLKTEESEDRVLDQMITEAPTPGVRPEQPTLLTQQIEVVIQSQIEQENLPTTHRIDLSPVK